MNKILFEKIELFEKLAAKLLSDGDTGTSNNNFDIEANIETIQIRASILQDILNGR